MKTKDKTREFGAFLADDSIPLQRRMEHLQMVIMSPDAEAVMHELIAGAKKRHAKTVYLKRCEKLEATLRELETGPLRGAAFVSCETNETSGAISAQVVLDDGQVAYSTITDKKLADSLQQGDRVLLDGRGRAVLRKAPTPLKTGEEAKFERLLDDGYLEVSVRDQERCVYFPTNGLREKIANGEVTPGQTLVVNPRQSMAFDVIPESEAHSHFEYLTRDPVPDVVAGRDIGCPPAAIDRIARHIRLEMSSPEIRRRFGLPRSTMSLFTGMPGTGKTLSIEAIWRIMYEIMSEETGVPLDELPHRVFRLRPGKVLSQWFGQSDRNIDRFFDEVIDLSSRKWADPEGREHELPVLVILEEVDGIARSRGGEAIYDRILTGILQRLDPNRADLADRHIIFLGTTNAPEQVDTAFLRRIGSTVEKFGHLDRAGFVTVLEKQIADLPVEHQPAERAHQALISDLAAWLFSPNGSDPGVVELNYTGSTSPDVRYRRDFLTGALVNRAVREASERAANEAHEGKNGSGIHLEHFVESIDRQILSTVDQMSEFNASRFVEIPDAARVANVRRLPQPDLFPLQLQR